MWFITTQTTYWFNQFILLSSMDILQLTSILKWSLLKCCLVFEQCRIKLDVWNIILTRLILYIPLVVLEHLSFFGSGSDTSPKSCNTSLSTFQIFVFHPKVTKSCNIMYICYNVIITLACCMFSLRNLSNVSSIRAEIVLSCKEWFHINIHNITLPSDNVVPQWLIEHLQITWATRLDTEATHCVFLITQK